MEETRTCTGCGETKPTEEFRFRPITPARKRAWRSARCRTCEAAYNREHRSPEVRQRQTREERRKRALSRYIETVAAVQTPKQRKRHYEPLPTERELQMWFHESRCRL